MKDTLGIDIGNVIIDHRTLSDSSRPTLDLETQYSQIPEIPGACDAIRTLAEKYFNANIYLVSKATPWAQEKIRQWLLDHDFYVRTTVSPDSVSFCAERAEKQALCADVGITHFIDDRLEVLSHLVKSVPHLYLFRPDDTEERGFDAILPLVTRVESWSEVVSDILKRV